ncbi:MAG TPA: TonB-dependent receptor plug domain-containing protein [Longimicrobium sp.]|jgi:tetratricopeptide (TPR) repeat protein
MRVREVVTCLAAMLLTATTIEGQTAAVAADLEECRLAGNGKEKERMEAAAARLEAAAAAMDAARPVEALVVRARVRTACQIPFAPLLRQGALVAEANELLERALAQDPGHLAARVMLGMNHYRAPAFLGRTDAAVEQLELVLRDHGTRAEPAVATTYLSLGELYARQGRRSLAAQTWRRGAAQFPAHAGLREKAGAPVAADSVRPASAPAPTPAPQQLAVVPQPAAPLAAQPPAATVQPAGPVATDLEECRLAAAEKTKERMEAAAARLEAAASAMEPARPVEALVLRARIRTQCQIPFAPVLRQGALVAEANELLERALGLDPQHLIARFMLGMNHSRAPAFLGRTDAAVEQLERVLRDHGTRTEPAVASTYLTLGELYARQGRRTLAAQTWRRGAAQFPSHPGLREKAGAPVAADSIAPRASSADSTARPAPQQASAADSAAGIPRPVVAAPRAPVLLAPILVMGSTYSVDDPRAATRLSKQEVYTMPGGTADVFQTFQTLPGVTRVGDSGDLYVRGGDPAETPIYVDGARLFHPGRFETLSGSIFGVFDPSVMRTAYFSSGGFSARYGNALSGIVALETDRRPTTRHWRAGANLVSLGGTFWQPLGERAGMWSTAMLTDARALLTLHGRTGDYPEAPASKQLMAGFSVEPMEGIEVRLGGLLVSDETTALISSTGYEGPFRSESGSRLGTAEIRAMGWDGKATARMTLAASTRDTRFGFGVLERDHEDRQFGTRIDGEVKGSRVTLRAGFEGALLEALSDGTVPTSGQVAPGSPSRTLESELDRADHLGGYTEVEWRATRRIALLGGVRADNLPGESGIQVDPRLAAAYSLNGWTYRVGGGRFSQGRWRTRYALPNQGNASGVPLRAHHLVAGVQRDGTPAVRVEAYVKRYDDYVAETGTDADAPQVVGGRSHGLDVLFRPQGVGPVVGWLTYSYLKGEIELEDGGWVPSRFDVTHTLSTVGKLSMGEYELGLTGRYGTGRPNTPILGASPPVGSAPATPLYGDLNSQRLPDYVRLDGRLSRLMRMRGGIVVAYVEGLNLLDRGNVMSYTYDAAYRDRQPVRTFFGDRTLVLGVEAQF